VLMFLILPLVDTRLYLLGLAGLALQGIGGWFMFNGISVSPLIIGISLTLGILYYVFALRPVLASQRGKGEMLEDQSLIGMKGYVQTLINPVGTVYVHGESWTARRGDDETDPIDVGAEIVVRDREELTLFVEPIKRKREGA
jgi:membrane protein implicated in regulation of membrane protease activity